MINQNNTNEHWCWVKLFAIHANPIHWEWLARSNRPVYEVRTCPSISPGVPRTLSVGFLAPCSRLPGCTSSPTCSMWWSGLPQTGWGPLHVQSWTCALPEWMLGRPHSSRMEVFTDILLERPPNLANVHTPALHTRDGSHYLLTVYEFCKDSE